MYKMKNVLAVSMMTIAVATAANAKIVSETMMNSALSGKQDTISDLSTIRSGASAGATAVQPSAISKMQNTDNMITATSGTGLTNNTTSTSKYPSMATASAMITDVLSSTVTDVSTLQDTSVKHTKSTAAGSATVPVYVATDGTATPITSYSGKAATAGTADTANSVAWANVSGKPTLATVATSGSYSDLSNKPTIPTVTDTYSATGTAAVSGKAVASAISDMETQTHASETYQVKGNYLTAHQDISGKQNVSNMVTATSGTGLTNNLTSTSKYPSMATASQMITDAIGEWRSNKQDQIAAGTSGNVVTYTGTAGSVGSLGFDDAPTANSNNLVKSGAIKTAVTTATNMIPSGSEGSTTLASIWVE